MTFHTEAREAVARLVWTCWNWEPTDTPWEQLTDTQGGKIDARDYADLILARLGELGYVQRDRLLSDAAVEAAAKAVWPYMGCEPCEPARHKIPWSGHSTAANKQEKDFARQAAQAALAAAIAKAGESA